MSSATATCTPGKRPGTASTIDEELAARYPYKPSALPVNRLEDGTHVELVEQSTQTPKCEDACGVLESGAEAAYEKPKYEDAAMQAASDHVAREPGAELQAEGP